MLRFGWLPILLVVGGLYWAWDATHHDSHDEKHGARVPTAVAELEAQGTWSLIDDGESREVTVSSASCRPGEGGDLLSPNTHFLCRLTLSSGEQETRVIHIILGNGLDAMIMSEVG